MVEKTENIYRVRTWIRWTVTRCMRRGFLSWIAIISAKTITTCCNVLDSRRYSLSLICSTLNYSTSKELFLTLIETLPARSRFTVFTADDILDVSIRVLNEWMEGGGGPIPLSKCHTPSDCLVQILIPFLFSCICGATSIGSERVDPGGPNPKGVKGGTQVFSNCLGLLRSLWETKNVRSTNAWRHFRGMMVHILHFMRSHLI